MVGRIIALTATLLGACGDRSVTNNACALYHETDRTSSCRPLKEGVGSGSAVDTAIVYYADGAGSKWCMTILDPHPLVCTTIHASPADQEAELAAAKAKITEAKLSSIDAGIVPDALLGPPFAPRP